MSTATIAIVDPTTRTDGAALTAAEIASIDIFDGGVAIAHLLGAAVSFTTGVLTVGDHPFTAVVTDTTGHVSAPSNVSTVTVVATLAPPSPAVITATLNP